MGWSKAAPPPPEPTVIDIVLAKAAEFPNVTTAILVVVNFYLLLNLLAAMMVKRPGVPIKARASDKVVYKKNEAVTVTDPKGEGIVRVAATGIASLKPTTLCKLFAAAAKTFPQKPALKVERGGAWMTWTWEEYYNASVGVARSLLSVKLGFRPHDCVNIIG